MIINDFAQMLVRFFICLIVNLVLIDRLYYPKSKRRSFYFTYLLTSIAVFFLMTFMIEMKAKATMGIGIGLFGIFSIMRFRTDAMPVREMTYLFLIISLSVVSAIAPVVDEQGNIDFSQCASLLITDVIVILITWICEIRLKVKNTKLINYDRIELANPAKYDELMEDVAKRTGLDIVRIEVGGMDFLKDSVVLKVYYNRATQESTNSVDSQFRVTKNQMRHV